MPDFGSPEHQGTLVKIYIGNNIASQIGLAILIITILSSKDLKNNRNPTLLNFLFTWFAYSFFASLLFYAGKAYGTKPGYTLCLVQGSIMYALTVMTIYSMLGVVLELLSTFRVIYLGIPSARDTLFRQFFLIGLSWTVFLAVFLLALTTGLKHPQDVTRDATLLRCSIPHHGIGETSLILVGIASAISYTAIIWITILLYRYWNVIKAMRARGEISMHFTLRVFNFLHFQLIGLAISAIYLENTYSHGAQMNIILSFQPLWAFLIFASQPDIYRSWFFWRRTKGSRDLNARRSTIIKLDDVYLPDLTKPMLAEHNHSRGDSTISFV